MSDGQLSPITFKLRKPLNPETGQEWDQTADAAANIRYAHSLGIPELQRRNPRMGRAIIVGGAPSIATELKNIRALAKDPDNAVFALNFSHNWLIERKITPYATVMFEIDAEPETMLRAAHPDVTYYICSHCHAKTFDQLAGSKRVLWHIDPQSPPEEAAAKDCFPNGIRLGGGIGTFLRTISLALVLGFRNIDVFGCDSSFPDDSPSTHVEGYTTANDVTTDAFYVVARAMNSDETRKFKTVSYLSFQIEEFKAYCTANHGLFALRVHGDSLLRYVHEKIYPDQYTSL